MSLIGETKKNNAFTLIEILLVLIIAGIVLALAVPNFSKGYSGFQLNKTADDVLDACRWAQAMSISQDRIYALSLTSDRRSYHLLREEANDENSDQPKFESVHGTLGRMHQVPQGVSLGLDSDQIEFYPDGTIDAATIQLESSGQKIVLSSSAVRGAMTKVDNE